MMEERRIIVVPGLGGSSPEHWQSMWESRHPEWIRFRPASWDDPSNEDWAEALGRAIDDGHGNVVIVAHSLGCLAALHVAARSASSVAGLFLVAPPDPEAATFPAVATDFATAIAELGRIGVPAVAVTSTSDPYCHPDRSEALCTRWGIARIDIGDAGHVNVASGHGPWPEGYRILTAFAEDVNAGEKTTIRDSRL